MLGLSYHVVQACSKYCVNIFFKNDQSHVCVLVQEGMVVLMEELSAGMFCFIGIVSRLKSSGIVHYIVQ